MLSTGSYQRLVPHSRSVPHYSFRMACRRSRAPGMGVGAPGDPLPGGGAATRENLDTPSVPPLQFGKEITFTASNILSVRYNRSNIQKDGTSALKHTKTSKSGRLFEPLVDPLRPRLCVFLMAYNKQL